jgi:hypothetical protein
LCGECIDECHELLSRLSVVDRELARH